MSSKKDSHRRMSDLCAEMYEDDGVDPRMALRRCRPSRGNTNRKAMQLCKQAHTAISSALRGESGDAVLAELEVIEVVPAPDESRLRVLVRLPAAAPQPGVDEARRRLVLQR